MAVYQIGFLCSHLESFLQRIKQSLTFCTVIIFLHILMFTYLRKINFMYSDVVGNFSV
jgi:hypothetical protein